MQKTRVTISYNHNFAHMGEDFCLTLCGMDNEEVELRLTKQQFALFNARLSRTFYVRCKKEKILREIDDASICSQLEQIALKYYLCDCCDLADINPYGAKRALKVMVNALYAYPKLRSKMSFIGTHDALARLLKMLEEGDIAVLNRFGLQYICTRQNARKLGKITRRMLSGLMQDHESYVATALSAFGLLDAVFLDKNDYDGYAYVRFVSLLRQNEAIGYHPKGCYTPESIIYHEIGHLLDNMCELADQSEFKKYYSGLSKDEIRRGLSEYALESPAEFIAESFAEYMCNSAPRPIAAEIVKMLNNIYQQL